jgi:hypothetical protein
MRQQIPFNEQEQKCYEIAKSIRNYAEKTKQSTYGFADAFYTMQSGSQDGKKFTHIKFKAHSFKNLMNMEAPEDIFQFDFDGKLLPAFMVGLLGSRPFWNVPAKNTTN